MRIYMSLETAQSKTDPAGIAQGSALFHLLVLMRPRQWVKNLLVFVGLIFSKSLSGWENIGMTVLGFAVFCAASSGVYIFNDLCDLKADKEHPVKKFRPLASGAISPGIARLTLLLLFAFAAAGALWLDWGFALIIATYLLMCLTYSLGLKTVVILDVMLIAAGFVLRAVSGAVILHVEVSQWLVLCTSMLALLIGFGKRRHELSILGDHAVDHRIALTDYSLQFLDLMMTVCGGAAIVTYALYTMSDETTARFGTKNLLLTLPFVIYGVFRYLFLIHKKKEGGDPVMIFFHDLPTQLNLAFWVLTLVAIIYGPEILSRLNL